jgi:dTDP-4-amino-4,6-dideoxygalactose transaminase
MPAVAFVDLARQHAQLGDALNTTFNRVLNSSGFILGEEVERFEAAYASYCGTRHCVGVASGTAALTIMMQAAGIAPGDEVIVPAHTFISTALAVMHAGATPVCVDVDQASGLIDPAAVAEAIGPGTAAILAVHLYGQVCAMEPLRALARRHGVVLFEDAAQAHGATYRDARAGSLGHAAAFSFYPSKNLGALGDAGAICTDDEALAARARRLRDLGRGGDSIHRVPGYNERLDGLQAALLRTKLSHLDEWNRARRVIAAAYVVNLDRDVELPEESSDSPSTYHVFPIRVPDRDGLKRELERAEISTRIHYRFALPDQPALRNACRWTSVARARDWARRELSLPIFPGMTEREIDRVVGAVNRWAGEQRAHNHEPRESHATLSG